MNFYVYHAFKAKVWKPLRCTRTHAHTHTRTRTHTKTTQPFFKPAYFTHEHNQRRSLMIRCFLNISFNPEMGERPLWTSVEIHHQPPRPIENIKIQENSILYRQTFVKRKRKKYIRWSTFPVQRLLGFVHFVL